jgi:hypothetical protein
MKINKSKILKKNKPTILENVKQAKQYIQQDKLTQDELKIFIDIDPTDSRKFVGWMAKQWVKGNISDKDELRNTIEEYHTFLKKGKAKTKDIYQIKSFQDLKKEVDEINQSGEGVSVKELEEDYEIVRDNSDMIIAVPHSHEASRKLGLSTFAFRDCGDGTKDSSWCTTYKAPDHFNDYYYSNNVTFYYIKAKSKDIVKKLKDTFPKKWKNLLVVAIAVLEGGKLDVYDGLDNQLSPLDIKKYRKIMSV